MAFSFPPQMRVIYAIVVCFVVYSARSQGERLRHPAAAAAAAAAAARALRGVGFDVFDAFQQYVGQSPNNRSFAQASMRDACSKRNVTILRVAATGFWPDDVRSWMDDPDAWWGAFRDFLGDAESSGCRLILDLFWNTFALPDLAGEPLRLALTDSASKTRQLHEKYTREAISAAGASPAVAAWELTNELNNLQDLDLSVQQPSIAPSRGTPSRRTRADNVSTADVAAWGATMTAYIKKHDPVGRPVSSGHSTPRKSAYHLMLSYPTGKEDFTEDTEAEFAEALQIAHAPFDLVSMHLYAGSGDNIRFNSTPVDPYTTDLLGVVKRVASNMSKQVLLGEFGDPLPGARPWTHSVLGALGSGVDEIDLALVWCFRFHQTAASLPANFSLELGRDDATIEAVAATNKAIVGQAVTDE